jgi:hypothetical protein
MNLVLDRMPDAGGAAFRAFGSIRRKPAADVAVPQMAVSLKASRFDPQRLRAYREICGFPESSGVPIPYPQVHAVHLQMHLMTQPEFPLPLVGLVHLKNRIVQERELAPDEPVGLQVAVAGNQHTDRGLEFDLATSCTDADGKGVWSSVATILHRTGKPSRKKGPPPPVDSRLSEYKAIDAPEDIGRRYGKIAGDMNPIHLYPLTAKLLGFQRHIAHGMWTMARCCALLQDGLGRPPRELAVQFKQPLFLPGRAALRYGRDGEGFAFGLVGRDGGKLHLAGTLR